ncbi:PET8 [Sanghuangporus sanghuang]
MGERLSPSFSQSLIAGGIAGTSVDLLFYPLDTVKTRLQSAQGFFNAGGFRGIYKGVGSVVIGSAPGAAVFFSTYDTLKRISPIPKEKEAITYVISASVAEVTACLIRVPTEVVKSRAQTSSTPQDGAKTRGSSLAAARYILTHDGLAGFYRGFGTTIMREIPFTSIQFPLYEFFKIRLARALHRPSLGAHEAAMCGSVAGGVAAALTTPLDVLKTRTMLDLRKMGTSVTPSLLSRLLEIYTKEGVKALFAGVVPRTLWISAGGAVFLGAYEWSVQSLTGVEKRLHKD